MAARHKVFPYKVRGKTLFLLMVDPTDHTAVAKVGYSLGYIVRPMVVPEFRMIQLLHDHYGVDERWRFNDTRSLTGPRRAPGAARPRDRRPRIDSAASRDEVMEAMLAICTGFFKRVIFFIVREPWVLGWSGLGEGIDRSLAASLRIPLDQPSVFQTVVARQDPVHRPAGARGREPALHEGARRSGRERTRPCSRSRCGAGSST